MDLNGMLGRRVGERGFGDIALICIESAVTGFVIEPRLLWITSQTREEYEHFKHSLIETFDLFALWLLLHSDRSSVGCQHLRRHRGQAQCA